MNKDIKTIEDIKFKTFKMDHIVSIGDTNLLGNMYFSNFFQLQGKIRELWVRNNVLNLNIILPQIILVTKEAKNHFIKDFYLFDEVEIHTYFINKNKASVDLFFLFFNKNTKELHSYGSQVIVFADRNHKICRIPKDFDNAIDLFLIK